MNFRTFSSHPMFFGSLSIAMSGTLATTFALIV
jgi:hypothetical protein